MFLAYQTNVTNRWESVRDSHQKNAIISDPSDHWLADNEIDSFYHYKIISAICVPWLSNHSYFPHH